MANKVLADLALRLYADTQELRKGLAQTKQKLSGFQKGLASVKGAIAGAFAVTAIVGAIRSVAQFSTEISDLTQKVKGLTNTTGGELVRVTAKIKALSDTFGAETEKLASASNTLAREMGVSQLEALSLIQKGYLSGADASGEFLDMVKEYPAQFKSAGLAGAESIALISQSVKEGIYSDKGADAIKESMLRLREMTPATRDAIDGIGLSSKALEKGLADGSLSMIDVIRTISTRLGELPASSAKVGTAIADIFGGAGEDAGLRFLTSLKDINLNLDELVKNQGASAQAQNRLANASTNLNTIWVGLFGEANTGFNNIKASIIELATNAIRGFQDLVNGFINAYNESIILRTAIEKIKFTFVAFWETTKLVFKSIVDGFTTIAKAGLYALDPRNWGEGFGEGLSNIVKDGFADIQANITDFSTNLGNAYVEGFRNAVENRLSNWTIVPEGEGEAQGNTYGEYFAKGVQAGFKSLSDQVNEDIQKGLAGITKTGEATDNLTEKITNLREAGKTAFDGIADGIGALVSKSEGAFKSFVGSILGGIRAVIKGLFAQAIAGLTAKEVMTKGVIGLGVAVAGITALSALWNSKVPEFATGGVMPYDGLALVGERGAELVSLSKGDRVLSHPQSKRLLDGGGGNVKFIIEGNNLVGILNKYANEANYF